MAEEQRSRAIAPTVVRIQIFIPSGEEGGVPPRGVFTAAVSMTPEIRAFLGRSIDQSAWKRRAPQLGATWADIEAELGPARGDEETT